MSVAVYFLGLLDEHVLVERGIVLDDLARVLGPLGGALLEAFDGVADELGAEWRDLAVALGRHVPIEYLGRRGDVYRLVFERDRRIDALLDGMRAPLLRRLVAQLSARMHHLLVVGQIRLDHFLLAKRLKLRIPMSGQTTLLLLP